MASPSAVANTQLRATPEVHMYDENLIYDMWCHISNKHHAKELTQKSCCNKHFFLMAVATIVYLQWVNQSYSQRVV